MNAPEPPTATAMPIVTLWPGTGEQHTHETGWAIGSRPGAVVIEAATWDHGILAAVSMSPEDAHQLARELQLSAAAADLAEPDERQEHTP